MATNHKSPVPQKPQDRGERPDFTSKGEENGKERDLCLGYLSQSGSGISVLVSSLHLLVLNVYRSSM